MGVCVTTGLAMGMPMCLIATFRLSKTKPNEALNADDGFMDIW